MSRFHRTREVRNHGMRSIASKIYRGIYRAVIPKSIIDWRKKVNKVKIRSDVELSDRFTGLCLVADKLDQLGVQWHISGGTALGVARSGDFIPWDWDVGFGIKFEEISYREEEVISLMQDAGLRLRMNSKKELKETIEFAYRGSVYELLLWHDDGEFRIRRSQKRPARFFDNVEYREFRGRRFPFPAPLEEYLEFLYDDWRTPKRTADKKVYRSVSSYR